MLKIKLLILAMILVANQAIAPNHQPDVSEYNCLVTALFHESRNQSEVGIQWVAGVIINRTKHKSYPSSICKVVLQNKQFSNIQEAFKRATSLPKQAGHSKVARIAFDTLYGDLRLPRGILFYHTKAVKPSWSKRLKKSSTVGDHIFYGLP